MSTRGSWFFLSSFLISLLSVLLSFSPSLAYSLKNCTADDNRTWVECADRDLAFIPDDIPKTAVTLDLRFNHISKINRTDFSRLSKLRYLQIGNNLISHVDNGAFADVELVNLDMGSNNLSNVTDNMFQGLTELIYLSLEKNQITYISPLAFQSLISLQTVQLTYNHLNQMTDIVPLLQLPNLNDLLADSNYFTSFQSDELLCNTSNLRTLAIFTDSKFSITRDVFPHLQSITLDTGSGLEWDVPDPIFLRNLTTFGLFVSNDSREMYQAMLKSAESVQDLSVSFFHHDREIELVDIACQSPKLTNLSLFISHTVGKNETFLRSCSQLTELDLSHNNLEELSEASLRSVKQLRSLDLASNALSRVPLGVRGLSLLEFLDLSSNVIGELGCSDFLNLTRLAQLYLKSNRISTLKGCVFQNLNDLKVLNVGENGVHVLVDFFKLNLQKLEVLDLNMNILMQLKTGDFKNMSSLKSLYLESSKFYVAHKGAYDGLNNLLTLSVTQFFGDMDSIANAFRGLQRLESLKIHLTSSYDSKSSQQNNETHSSISPLAFLKSLLIQNYDWHHQILPDFLKGLNSLDYFGAERFFTESPHPDTFKYTPHLTSLHIFQSDLQVFNPEVFQPIPNLQSLDLSKNKLRSLDFLAKANLSALRVLTVRDNALTVIDEVVIQSLPALTYLDLTGNPFTCSCSNAGFIQWVKNNNQTQAVNAYQYPCIFPVAEQGNKLLDFDVQSCWM
ncbi:toll-like receptor 13, partial [Plectropomus leopardus]|uniref:toll-like receptor 13 n=1 Tax=Plectropomus leopardus TaxID=160734 RepID=UPI001C4AEE08